MAGIRSRRLRSSTLSKTGARSRRRTCRRSRGTRLPGSRCCATRRANSSSFASGTPGAGMHRRAIRRSRWRGWRRCGRGGKSPVFATDHGRAYSAVMSRPIIRLASCLMLALAWVSRAAPPGDRDAAADVMRATVERFALDRDALQRRYPDGVGERSRLTRFREERRKELEAVDFDKLAQPGRIDYILLRSRIAFEEKSAEHRRKQLAEV